MRFLALFAAVAALVVAPAAMAAPKYAEPSRVAGGQVTKLHLHVVGERVRSQKSEFAG